MDPDLTKVLKDSRDYDELLWAWKGWHDETGPKMRSIYAKTVEINNNGARENGYKDLSERWIEDYEDDEFEKKFDDLFNEIKPLYQQLHAYVRRKLNGFYGKHYTSDHDESLIPAHLLGNMWAQSWENIYDLVLPYPKAKKVNITKILNDKKYTPIKMFKVNH